MSAQANHANRPDPDFPAETGDTPQQRIVALLRAAMDLHQAGDAVEAEKQYKAVIAADLECVTGYFGLALLYRQQGLLSEAYGLYKHALTLDEENAQGWRQFGSCLSALGQHEAAAIAFGRASALLTEDADCLVDLGWALYHGGDVEQALAVFGSSLERDPDNAQAHYGKGQQHLALGEIEEARAMFERSHALDPECAETCFRLAGLAETPDAIETLIGHAEALIRANPGSDPKREAALHFAVAEGHRRREKYDKAFTYFTRANDLSKQYFAFDRNQVRQLVDETIAAFQPAVFEDLAAAGSDSEKPVFIVGMPRSGSTLVEQIISGHGQTGAAGEFRKLGRMVDVLSAGPEDAPRYPLNVTAIPIENLAAMGEDYLAALCERQPEEAQRVTDKRLANFLHLGLIAVLFPKASIIHCRRDPMDICLSCYFQRFSDGGRLGYTAGLEDLGFYHRQYARLMQHWREVLPLPVLDVDYEDVVEDLEAASRRIVDHLGLAWDDACLDFQAAATGVRTASSLQVRQPVYKSSTGAWRHYEKHLEPLKRALEGKDA